MWYISFCHFQRFLQRSHQKPQVRRAATICLVLVAIFLPSQSCPGSPWSKSPAGLTLHFPENQTTPPPSHVFVKRNLKSSRSSLPTQRAWGIPQAPFCSLPATLQRPYIIVATHLQNRLLSFSVLGWEPANAAKPLSSEGAEPAGEVPRAFESAILFHRNRRQWFDVLKCKLYHFWF